MKKMIMMSLMAMMTAMTVNAQNNTYTMVIEMQNGTKISIGPNEVKNVSFKDGEITVSGGTVESIMQMITNNHSALLSKIDDVNSALDSRITANEGSIKTLQDKTTMNDAAYHKELDAKISKLSGQIENVLDIAQKAQQKATENSTNIATINTNIAKLSTDLSNMQKSIAELEKKVSGNNPNPDDPNPDDPTPDEPTSDGISAYYAGGSITQANETIQSGSKLNWTFSNGGKKSVILTRMQMINGKTNSVGNNLLTENVEVAAGKSVSYTITVGILGIESPIMRFTYLYNGEEKTIEAKYKSFSF